MKSSEIKNDRRIAIVGDSGTGKTWIIGTLCRYVPTLVVTADASGLDTFRQMGVDPDIVLIESWDNAWDALAEIKSYEGKSKALAIDDFGKVQERGVQRVEGKPRGRDEERMRPDALSAMTRKGLVLGDRKMILPQFGEVAVASESFLYELLSTAFPIKVMTMLLETREHPRTGQDALYPALLGNIRYDILSRFSLVLNTFMERREATTLFCATSRPHPRLGTKDRYSPGRTWVDPTAERILAHIVGPDEHETPTETQIGVGIH